MCLCADSPDAPQNLEIVKFDRYSVNLAWKAPKSDGGAPIKSYLVEKRLKRGGEGGGAWQKATPFPIEETRAIVSNLETGFEYEFRVTAVNEAGPGTPTKPLGPHLVRDPICMLYVTSFLSALHNVRVQFSTSAILYTSTILIQFNTVQ